MSLESSIQELREAHNTVITNASLWITESQRRRDFSLMHTKALEVLDQKGGLSSDLLHVHLYVGRGEKPHVFSRNRIGIWLTPFTSRRVKNYVITSADGIARVSGIIDSEAVINNHLQRPDFVCIEDPTEYRKRTEKELERVIYFSDPGRMRQLPAYLRDRLNGLEVALRARDFSTPKVPG